MKSLLLVASLFLVPFLLTAQAPAIAAGWGSTGLALNNSQDEYTQYVLPTSDGNFLLVGTSVLGSVSSIWAVKISSGGSLQASVRYPLTSLFMPQAATAAEVDGGYAIVARLGGTGSDHNARFLVNKSTLQVVAGTQSITYGEGSTCAAKTSTGLLLMGSPGSSAQNRAARVEVLDPTDLSIVGAIQLEGFFGGGPAVWGEGLHTILPTADGGFYLIGEDTRDEGGLLDEAGCIDANGALQTSDVWVCKVNADLRPVWSRTYGGLTEDRVLDAALRDNGNIVLMGRTPCGTTTSGPLLVGPGTWMLELSPLGNALYAVSLNAFQNANGTVTGLGLLKGCPDGLLLSGQRNITSGTTGTAAYVAKVRVGPSGLVASYATGSGTWKREILPVSGGQRHFIAEDIQQMADGRFIAWGSASPSIPPAAYVGNFWAVLLSTETAPVCAANPTTGAITVACGAVRNGETTASLSTSNGQYGNYLGVPGLPASTYAGPEKAYKITIPPASGRSNLKVTMDLVTTNIGLDMFLFSGKPQEGCLAGSVENNINGVATRKEIIEKILDPGDYFIVVDGRLSTDKGIFNLTFECAPCSACACSEANDDLPTGRKLLSDDFEQYNLANLDPQNIRWSTGTNLTTYPQVVQLTGETKTVQIKGINRPLQYDFAGLPDNRYRLSWQIFVADGKTAAFDVFGNNDPSLPGFLDFRFRADGMAELNQTDDFKRFPYLKGSWNQITLMLDMAQDSAEIWLNGDFISRTHLYENGQDDQQPPNNFPEETLLCRLRFSSDAESDYRIDNLCLWEKTGCTPPPAPSPGTCLSVPSDRIFNSLAAARCDLYTTREVRNCQSVCDLNGTVFHRDPTFSGIVGPAAPPSLALSSDCVQQDNSQWANPARFADLVTFYNESSKRIGINFNSNDADTRAFVFQCFCEDGLSGTIALDGNTITANGCEQVCLGEVNNDYDGNSPRQKGYYYILILSPTEDKYNLSIIPEGPCGANIIPLQCGVAAGGSLSGEDNTFPTSFPTAYQNYSGPRTYTGRDKVYTFSLQRPQHIDLSLTANRAMGFFLYTDQCGTNPILYRETPILGGIAQLDSFFLPAATYFLAVDEVTLNTVSKYTLLLSNCSDGDVNTFLPQFATSPGTACLTTITSPHTVSLGASVFSLAQSTPQPGKPAIRLNDLVQFKYKDGSGQERTSAFQFWNGVSLNFPLAADAPGDPKCGYRAGDSLQMAIQHYDNGASQYINYQITPVSGNPVVYQASGSTSVSALKVVRKPTFFKVNPLILNPSHKGEDYKVRGRSSDFDWVVSEHQAYDWISIPEPDGEAKTEYDKKIVFEPNTGAQPREAKLLFRSTSTHPDYKNFVDTVRILQRGTNCTVPPAATVTTSPASPCAGREFTLTATHNPANPYYEYQWSHGKTGSIIKEIAPDLGSAGNISYSLTVFDRACGLASTAQTLTVPIGASTAWVSTDTPTQGNLINGEKSGTALARFGDWVAIGSPEWNASTTVTKAGRVLLYKRTAPNTWTFKQDIKAPTPVINDFFGYALSMQGDLLLVGAPAAQNGITITTPSSTKPGAAYLFKRNADDSWSMTGSKMTSGSLVFDNFGTSVALQGGEYAFVGADAAASNRVCIFHRDEGGAGTWGRLSTFLSGFINGTSIGRFGCSLMADGKYLAVGAKNTGGVGATFIFQHAPQLDAPHLWGQVNALQIPIGEDMAETDDRFGYSVALRGNYLLVGAPYHDNDNTGTNSNRGAAWLFERDIVAGWKKIRKILPSGGTPANDDFFGSSLSLGDGYAAIGAEREGSTDAGAAYLYHQEKKDGTPLRPFAFVRRFAPNTGDMGFGAAVCVSTRSLLAGAPITSTNKGKAYFYKPACTGQEQTDEREAPIESYQPAVAEAAGLTLQCYPVPFQEELLVEVAAEQSTSARIEVLDVLGRSVGLIYDGGLEGRQSFRWDALRLPPGSYWVRVSAEQGQVSQQVIKM